MRGAPLSGVTVLEFAGIGPGPFAGMALADLGADVIRIDRPDGSELSAAPAVSDVLNRGKRSIILDLKKPAAVQAALALIEGADVVIEGYRPGVMERLGLGPEIVQARNERAVYVRMTGWGQSGPLAHRAGHDINYLAVTGVLGALGAADGPPQVPFPVIADYGGGGTYCLIGLLAALLDVSRTGRGQVLDVAMVDGVLHLIAATHSMLGAGRWHDQRGTNVLDGASPFYCLYQTRDNRWMAVGALENRFFALLLETLGIKPDEYATEDQHDETKWSYLRRRLTDIFAGRTLKEWTEVFMESDACVTPVLGLREAATHPHIVARGSLLTEGQRIQSAAAPRFSRWSASAPGPSPVPGQHTREILSSTDVAVEFLLDCGAAIECQPDAHHSGDVGWDETPSPDG